MFFYKINKIDKPLARLTKIYREKTKITKIQKKRVDIIANLTETKLNIREFKQQLTIYSQLYNLDGNNKVLEKLSLLQLTLEEI